MMSKTEPLDHSSSTPIHNAYLTFSLIGVVISLTLTQDCPLWFWGTFVVFGPFGALIRWAVKKNHEVPPKFDRNLAIALAIGAGFAFGMMLVGHCVDPPF